MEIEELIQKFEARDKELRADVAKLKTAITEAVGQQALATEKDEELGEKIATLEQALKDRNGAIDELKTLTLALHRDTDEVDPIYMGKDVPGFKGRKRYFPNAKRAKSFGLFCMAIAEAGERSEKARIALDKIDKALAEGANSTGGALIPEVFVPTLIRMQEEYGTFRRNARNVPMAGEKVTWPKLDGHITVYCPGEGGTITASNPTFQNVVLEAEKFVALTVMSSEVDEDAAVVLGEIIVADFARGFAKAEDEIGFLGNGSSTYWGMTGIAGALRAVDATIGNIKSLVVGTGNAYSELILGDFDEVVGKFPNFADGDEAKWYMHKYFYWTVVRPLQMAYSSNIPTIGMPANVSQGAQLELDGYNIELVNVMPKAEANSQICANLANLNMGAYLGDRRGIRIERSRDAYFTTDQIGIRATRRTAINVFGVGDTTDEGPVMGLITAAA